MRRATVAGALLVLLLASENLLADGFMILPSITVNYAGTEKVSSDAQKALLVWNQGQETLHLQSSYRGPASDFAWVIPIPRRPHVERSDWRLFEQAEKATRPEVIVERVELFPGLNIGCAAGEVRTEQQTLPTGVREIESLDIREFHIDIVSASDAGGFVGWLQTHDYAVDAKARPVLGKYVDKEFFFVVAKIQKSSTWAQRKGITESVSGGLTPLAITFAAERPFYPLAVSAISSAVENELLLITAAAGRLEPVEYGCTELSHEDVKETVGAVLRKTGNPLLTKGIDFGPAVKAAQERTTVPAMVVEYVTEMAWQGKGFSRLVGAGSLFGGRAVRLTRFHCFLRPDEMRDITFLPAKDDSLFQGRFYIPLRWRKGDPPVSASAGLLSLALISAVAARRKAWSGRNVEKLALLLLLLWLTLG